MEPFGRAREGPPRWAPSWWEGDPRDLAQLCGLLSVMCDFVNFWSLEERRRSTLLKLWEDADAAVAEKWPASTHPHGPPPAFLREVERARQAAEEAHVRELHAAIDAAGLSSLTPVGRAV